MQEDHGVNPFAPPSRWAAESNNRSRLPSAISFSYELFAGFALQFLGVLLATFLMALTRNLGERLIHFVLCLVAPVFISGIWISLRRFRWPKSAALIGLGMVAFSFAVLTSMDAKGVVARTTPFVAAIVVIAISWCGVLLGGRWVRDLRISDE